MHTTPPQDNLLSLSAAFPEASEADWLAELRSALKGGDPTSLQRLTIEDLPIRPLYRETDYASASGPRSMPGVSPYLRGAHSSPDPFLPWDIRQAFTHPDPKTSNAEILRDLERGVSSIELVIDMNGREGIILHDLAAFTRVLKDVRGDIATIALDNLGGTGTRAAALLALWGQQQAQPSAQKLAFNIDPLASLARTGKIKGGINPALARATELGQALALQFPLARIFRVDSRPLHEAGAGEALELAGLIAQGLDLMRRLDAQRLPPSQTAPLLLFTLSLDANYGLGIAKLRAARRLWAQIQSALGLPPSPMHLQAVTSARMLARYDASVNMLRGAAACFAGAVGGADIISVRPFNSAHGVPEELGRRLARNTQNIAMLECGLGRVADPSGGAWFTEALSEDLSQAAWTLFQAIEAEGGYAEALISGSLQARIQATRARLEDDVAHRRSFITGVSDFPNLNEAPVPIGEIGFIKPKAGLDEAGLAAILPAYKEQLAADTFCDPLIPIRLSAPFEALRARAEKQHILTGLRPKVLLCPLGPLAEHAARADFARNLFAVGGFDTQIISQPSKLPFLPKFQTALIILCGSDKRYALEAASALASIKAQGAHDIWIAGTYEIEGLTGRIYAGCNVLDALARAHDLLGNPA